MVICDTGRFFYRLIQRLLCLEAVQIDAFIFQCAEIPFLGALPYGAPALLVLRLTWTDSQNSTKAFNVY